MAKLLAKLSVNMSRVSESLVSMMFRNVSEECNTQEMCERVNLEFNRTLKFVPDEYKTRKMWERAAVEDSVTLDIFLTDIRPDRCEKEL